VETSTGATDNHNVSFESSPIFAIIETMFSITTPSDHVTALGLRVRALRLQRNETQAALAARAGVSTPTLAALEDGRGTLLTLARVLYALGRERELDALVPADPPARLDDVVAPRTRRRARP
jgi:DNA-binding XRE family transcriptional regulator